MIAVHGVRTDRWKGISGLRAALCATALVAFAPGLAAAGASSPPGLYLTWQDCAQSPNATANRSVACDGAAGEEALYLAFSLPWALDSVVAVEAVVDVQAAGVLPPWWQYGPEGCRSGSLHARGEFPAGTACTDFWMGDATLDGLQGYYAGEPRGGAGQARIRVALAVLPQLYRRLEAGTMYHAARLVFSDVGVSACLGCQMPVCLVLNSILIGRLPGAPGGDLLLEAAALAGSNQATWQGSGADCQLVPVVRTTWGAIKAMYR